MCSSRKLLIADFILTAPNTVYCCRISISLIENYIWLTCDHFPVVYMCYMLKKCIFKFPLLTHLDVLINTIQWAIMSITVLSSLPKLFVVPFKNKIIITALHTTGFTAIAYFTFTHETQKHLLTRVYKLKCIMFRHM